MPDACDASRHGCCGICMHQLRTSANCMHRTSRGIATRHTHGTSAPPPSPRRRDSDALAHLLVIPDAGVSRGFLDAPPPLDCRTAPPLVAALVQGTPSNALEPLRCGLHGSPPTTTAGPVAPLPPLKLLLVACWLLSAAAAAAATLMGPGAWASRDAVRKGCSPGNGEARAAKGPRPDSAASMAAEEAKGVGPRLVAAVAIAAGRTPRGGRAPHGRGRLAEPHRLQGHYGEST